MPRPCSIPCSLAAALTLAAAAPAGGQISARFHEGNFEPGVNQPTLAGGFQGALVCTAELPALAFPDRASFTALPGCASLGAPPGSGFTFGARFTGTLRAPADGMYTLDFTADDGTALHVGGVNAFSRWFDQMGGFSESVALVAGDNPFVLDYYANTYGFSFLTVDLPQGVSFVRATAVPEPGTIGLLAAGLLALGASAARTRRRGA